MLAQLFKSAEELGLTELQKSALMKTLVLLETGRLCHVRGDFKIISISSMQYTGHFNMQTWAADSDCGTVRCIGGTAEAVGDVRFADWPLGASYREDHPKRRLFNLFSPPLAYKLWSAITDAQAATALRSYLTCGDAKWHEAMAMMGEEK